MTRCRHGLCVWLMAMFAVSNSAAEELRIGVASNFAAPMKQLVQTFQLQHSYYVKVSYGSSGKLYAQINHGAPFQIFFSADERKPERLISDGLAVPESLFTYAMGQLVLWSADDALFSPQADIKPLLLQSSVKRIALANPRLAPYGLAAAEVLQTLDLTNTTRSQWVMGENIAQTYHFVRTGNATLGFVARSQLSQPSNEIPGSFKMIPKKYHTPIRQNAVLLKSAANNEAALAFLSFIRGELARNIIQSFGYDLDATSQSE